VWGWIIRIVVTVTYALLTVIVPATSTLVDQGPRVAAIVAAYPRQVKVLQTVDPATLVALKANANDRLAQVRALSDLSGLSTADVGKVVVLSAKAKAAPASVAPADLAFLKTSGPKVQQATSQLVLLNKLPSSDAAYLQANAAKVAKAQRDNPGQWQTWWWICFAAQALFIPFVFLLTGHWNPRQAREAEREHEQMVRRELARLHADRAAA